MREQLSHTLLSSEQADEPAIKANRLKGPMQPFEFILAETVNDTRNELEGFIRQGFAKCYDAQVNTFLPLLLGIKTKQLRAAVGVRRASSPLFIEQYLSTSITQALAEKGIEAERSQIAEMGNLYSQSHRFTLPLIMTVVMGLYLTDVRHLVFSGTDKVRQLLTALGFPMHHLAQACPDHLADDASDWGSYYANQPQVMSLDIEAAIKVAFQKRELHDLLAIVQANSEHLITPMRNL